MDLGPIGAGGAVGTRTALGGYEGNPQQILERREAVSLVPLLIMHGALDDNVLPAVQEKFAATYLR